MKKLSILLAMVISLTMVTTACGGNNQQDPNGDNQTGIESTAGENESTAGSDDASDGTKADDKITAPDDENKNDSIVTKPPVSEISETSKVRYAYSTLTADEKALYEKILIAATNHYNTADLDKPVTNAQYAKVFALVYYEEPQLFWLRGALDNFEGTTSSINLYYKYDYQTAQNMQKEIDAKVNTIKGQIAANATIIDKIKVIHDYIALNGDFTKDGPNVTNIYGALVDGKIQCEGYAKTVGYLCDQLGIENMLVPGANSEGASHAWNVLKVNGQWYNLDVTWDDPMNNPDKTYIRYNYFLVTDDEIINKTHFPNTSYFTAPKCTATDANYQKTYGLYANSVDEAKKILASELKKASDNKLTQVQIKCSSAKVLNDVKAGINAKDLASNAGGKNKIDTSKVSVVTDDNVLTLQIKLAY